MPQHIPNETQKVTIDYLLKELQTALGDGKINGQPDTVLLLMSMGGKSSTFIVGDHINLVCTVAECMSSVEILPVIISQAAQALMHDDN